MEIREGRHGEVVVLKCGGDLNLLNVRVRELTENPDRKLVIDYSTLGHVGTTHVGLAILATIRLRPVSGAVVVVCRNPEIREYIPCETPRMFHTLDEALEFLARDTDGPPTDTII
jgi:anti-anti-sigma regulatory factor